MVATAKIIADSVNPEGERILSIQIRVQRFVWAEVLTHRKLSRSAGSSRAIPVKRLTQTILDDPAMPVYWGAAQSGMQAFKECNNPVLHPVTGELLSREAAWEAAAASGVSWARAFADAGYHKQISNRPAENLGHITALITATSFDNFFTLRRHRDAQPEIKALADVMYEAIEASAPQILIHGQWHMPYITPEDRMAVRDTTTDMNEVNKILLKVSTARNARNSYLTHDGEPTPIEKDVKLHDDLVVSEPLHASPAEHCATPLNRDVCFPPTDLCANFDGWMQYRRFLETNTPLPDFV